MSEKNQHLDELKEVWERAMDSLFLEPKSLLEIAETYSKKTDSYILKTEKSEGISFIAGKFFIKFEDDKNIYSHADLYFKNSQENWSKKELKSKLNKSFFTEEAYIQIQSNKVEEFNISHPLKS